MPLLKKEPFVKQRPPPNLKPTDEVYHCKLTNEIFLDYEQFFERVILCNSLVWTCGLTGRPGLTYQEALDSEQKARKRLASFPDSLQKPILFLASLTTRSRLNDLNDDVFNFAKERFFINEIVEVILDGYKHNCRILGVNTGEASPGGDDSSDDDVICLDDPQPGKSPDKKAPNEYVYTVGKIKTGEMYTVEADLINRRKGVYTREKSKLFVKQHCDLGMDGIWKVKAKFIKKFKFAEARFDDFFGGVAPKFPVSIAKKKPKVKGAKANTSAGVIDLTEDGAVKKKRGRKRKEEKLMEDLQKAQSMVMSVEQRQELREKLRLEKLAIKEQEKNRRREEREELREKKKEEKRVREEFLKDWSRHRDDLECDDLKDLPVPEPISLPLSPDLFGDAVMVLEYLHCFNTLFDVQAQFSEKITLKALSAALTGTEVNGLYFDLVKFLLMAIFNLQAEEEEEELEFKQENMREKVDMQEIVKTSASVKDLVKESNVVSRWPQLNYSTTLSRMQLDTFTLTEVLRLHLLSSGSSLNLDDKFRYQKRGGYSPLDDPALELRRRSPELCDAMASKAVYDLEPGQKLAILETLINQLLTFVGCREFVELNFEKLRELKIELKQHRTKELMRERDEAAFWYRKRVDERRREAEAEAERKAEKKKKREERLQLDEMKKEAKGLGRDLEEYLKEKGHEDLLIRLEEDRKEALEKCEQEGKNKSADAEKDASNIDPKDLEPERRSSRQKQKKDEAIVDVELPTDNVDWEKLTPEERVRWKEATIKKEQDFMKLITELAHGNAIIPLGRDRTFRRYWSFQSLPGLFVEDAEMHIPEDYLCPSEQKQGITKTVEEQLNTSDKENEGGANVAKDSDVVMAEGNKVNGGIIETALPATLSVHEQCKKHGQVKWAFFTSPAQIDLLIDSLNARGFREGALRSVLQERKHLIVDAIENCPMNQLRADDPAADKTKSSKSRKVTPLQGAVCNSSGQELLELNLRESLLELEERIYAGSLGSVKAANRVAWREAIEDGGYDPQDGDYVNADNVSKTEGEESMEVEGEEAKVNTVSVARNLSMALLQIAKGLDAKFLSPPLGEDEQTKKEKQQAALAAAFKGLHESPFKKAKTEKKAGDDSSSESEVEEGEATPNLKSAFERWEESLRSCTSISQVFLHLSVLEKAICWSKSALNAYCRICRRKGDAEKMLLCDVCDRGHHMYCLKPAVKKVPAGDWYCPNCRPKDIMRTPRKARRQSSLRDSTEADDDDEEDEDDSDSSSGDDSDSDDSDDSDSDDSDEDDEDEDEDEDESDEEEETPIPAKILIGKAKGKKKANSGRSTPMSVGSGRNSRSQTRESTPVESRSSRVRQRLNMDGHDGADAKRSGRSRSRNNTPPKGKGKATPKGRHSTGGNAKKPVNGHQRSKSQGALKRKAEDDETSSKVASKSRSNEMTHQMKQCESLVKELMEQDNAWPFLQPVTKKEAPDYFKIIKEPMDFSTIKVNINKFQYSGPASVLEDIRLVFTNCERYNVNTAEEYVAGQKLCRYFVKRVKEMKLDAVLARRAQEMLDKEKSPENGAGPKPAKRTRRSH